MDAASSSSQAKWELAQSLIHGTNGMLSKPVKGVKLLHELTTKPIIDNDDTYVVPALKHLASLYLNGSSDDNTNESSDVRVAQDTETGLSYLRQSHTEFGDAEAAHDMALIYEYGKHGVEIDVVAAFEWFSNSANAGHIEAMAELGLCYELGCGVEQSDQNALDWYMKAPELGHNTAKYSIGEVFEEARGVPQSHEEACLWYYKAAIEGCKDSRKALRRLEDIARIVVPGVRALLMAE